LAFEALALAYEAKFVFEHIRGPMYFEYEWEEMPLDPDQSTEQRRRRGPYYATLKRIRDNKDFFERAWKLQPRCMAVFDRRAEDVFMLLHRSRREIEVAAQMLANRPADDNSAGGDPDLWKQMKADVWSGFGKFAKEGDRVGRRLAEFQNGMEAMCRPVIDEKFRN
jgi:hypothetical protein